MIRILTSIQTATLALALSTVARAESLEETYAKLCAGEVRSETCDVLRKALLEKLSAVDTPQKEAVSADDARRDALIAKWGFQGREALIGKQLAINQSMSPGNKFSTYSYGVMLYEYEWLSDTQLKKTTSLLESTSYSWGYGAKGAPDPLPASALFRWVETMTLDEAAAKINVEQRHVSGSMTGTEHKYQIGLGQASAFGHPFHQEHKVGEDLIFTDGSYEGENRDIVSGKIVNGVKVPSSYVRIFKVDALSPAQINALIAGEKQKFVATISQLHQKQSSGDGWLRALIGAGVGLAAGQAYGLDSTQTLGAVMKGIEVTSNGNAAGAAAGTVGDQLIGNSSGTTPTRTTGNASYPTKPNLASSACIGFTEDNYRTKSAEGGGDSQLKTMCGQAFEYYTMYKRAIAQGYSESDANRTYAAHEDSARVASGYLQSHGER